jgi:hypothetical protein
MSNFPREQGSQPENTNALQHGVYSYQQSGDIPEPRQSSEAMTRIQEIRENLATAEGLEKEQEWVTEKALVSLELALSWVKEKREEGRPLDNIKIFKMVPALINSAGRQISQLMDVKDKLGKVDALIADYEEIIGEAE